eukprot:TRINITY_DN6222_c0_g1_i2.p1 TRINITY_DN6222_c0_g1~~TRINITY_DN6222_c0_g1_i2.p1  ORF type:complete len:204 (+),score=38.24 TRINITY_DN6222_c0_g1_i2:491-1102(+)
MIICEVTSSDIAGISGKGAEKFQFGDLPENCEAKVLVLIPDISKKNSPPLHRFPLRKTDKGWLGVELVGVTISDVDAGGPADAAGLRVGMSGSQKEQKKAKKTTNFTSSLFFSFSTFIFKHSSSTGMVVRGVSGVPITEDNIYDVIMNKENTQLFHIDVLIKHTDSFCYIQPNNNAPITGSALMKAANICFETEVNSEGTESD